jgi:hypothetical protein
MWSRDCRAEFVPDEIGVLLGWTKMAAAARYDTACRAADLPALAAAWRAGNVDARRVGVIAEQVSSLDSGIDPVDQPTVTRGEIDALASAAVEYATEPGRCRTAPQLREWLRRKVVAVNPAAAEVRRQRAMGDRRVVITPGEDGMAELWALLPGVAARQIQTTLTTTAQQIGAGDRGAGDRGAGDVRSMDQRRADSLVDLLLGRADPPAVSLQVVVAADSLAGTSQEPGWVPGLGPVTATEIAELTGTEMGAHVTVRQLLTDPATGVLTDVTESRYRPSAALDRAVRTRDVTCRFPGCRRSADSAGTDLDHTIPWPSGATAAANLAVLCRRHHRLKHTTGWTATLAPDGTMTWTTPTGRKLQTEPWRYTDPDPPPDE